MQAPSTKILQNGRTDFSFIVRFKKRNEDGTFSAISIPPDADFEIHFFANNGVRFKATRINGKYNYCEKVDDSRLRVYIPLSRCFLGDGWLCQELWIRTPGGFWNGNTENVCLPSYPGFWLWNGPSDDSRLSADIDAVIGGAYHGKDGLSAFYNIHTKKNNRSGADDVKVGPYDFYTVIEGVTADNLAEMADTDKYRLVLLQERKHQGEGRRWRIPMLPYEQTKRTGRDVQSRIAETDTWWPVTGRIVPWFRDGRKLDQAVSLTITPAYNRFASTRSIKRRIGVALFKYTGAAGEGWTRISNIAYIELLVCNRTTDVPNIQVTVIS